MVLQKQFILYQRKDSLSVWNTQINTHFLIIKQIAYLITPHPCRDFSFKKEEKKKDDHRPI